MNAPTVTTVPPTDDFNVFLHELRTRELRRMPPGGRRFLSGGCAGAWYFDWIAESYPGIEQHIGVEAYSPAPEVLPPNVRWIANYLGDLRDVASGEVDLVFAGQTVEHMWPEDLAGFLCESHRVLSPDGWLVLDSPNRLITTRLGWHQPQHTAELSVDEVVRLVGAAGFDVVDVRGVWLCYDRQRHVMLRLDPSKIDVLDVGTRLELSAVRPEDSFIWWLEARRAERPPEPEIVRRLATEYFDVGSSLAETRLFHQVGRVEGAGRGRRIRTDARVRGAAAHGPYIPLRPGEYEVRFSLGVPRRRGLRARRFNPVVAELRITADNGGELLETRDVHAKDLGRGKMTDIVVPFALDATAFGVEFAVHTTGATPLVVSAHRDLIDKAALRVALSR